MMLIIEALHMTHHSYLGITLFLIAREDTIRRIRDIVLSLSLDHLGDEPLLEHEWNMPIYLRPVESGLPGDILYAASFELEQCDIYLCHDSRESEIFEYTDKIIYHMTQFVTNKNLYQYMFIECIVKFL